MSCAVTDSNKRTILRVFFLPVGVPLVLFAGFFTLKAILQDSPEDIAAMNRRANVSEEPHSIPPCTWNDDCDDGNPCTYDHCKMDWEGTRSCTNDFDYVYNAACRISFCDRETGKERTTNLVDGTACDPGDYILNGHCQDGRCVGDSVIVCNDENSCTRDHMWKDRCNFVACVADSYREGLACDNGGHCHHGICHDSDPPD